MELIRCELTPASAPSALTLHVTGAGRIKLVWFRRRSVVVPLSALAAIEDVPNGLEEADGPRGPGTSIPNVAVFATTRARSDGAKTLAVVDGPGPAVCLRLDPPVGKWHKVVLSHRAVAPTLDVLRRLMN